MSCDNECKKCMQDPDSECAVKNKEVWNKFYEKIYQKCLVKVDNNNNCKNIKRMKRIFLNEQLN